jgi:hypothetical protein
MLINISNHPSSDWPGNQKNAALIVFGEITDIRFPYIDPASGPDVIMVVAHKYADQCFQQLNNITMEQYPHAVHIMGEMTFCFTLVSLLQRRGIRCLASTTERIVSQNGNQKSSEFRFIRFRDYPNLMKP